MHELGIANSILQAVETEMRPHPGARAVRIAVTVGALSGIDRDSLEFCFGALTKGTPFESLALDVKEAASDELELTCLEVEETTP
jgi:hydrogenase nickel incorporation protein HypA/HybF